MASDWIGCRLGDLADLSKLQLDPRESPTTLYSHYSIPAFDDSQSPSLEFGSAIGSNKFVVPPNAVLVSKLNPRIPRVWVPQTQQSLPAIASTEFLVLLPKPGVPRRLLSSLFLSPAVRTAMSSRVTGTSGSHQRVRPEDALNITVEVPRDVGVRSAVASVLGAFDEKLELNRQTVELMESYVRVLFKSWFVDYDPVRANAGQLPLRLDPRHLAAFPDSFTRSTLGDFPVGWRAGTLGEIAENPRQGRPADSLTSSDPYIALEHMPRRRIALTTWGSAGDIESGKFAFSRGDILFGKLRPYFHKVGVAPIDGVCSTDILVVRPRSAMAFGLVLGVVSSDIFVEYTNAGSTGTKMPRTSWNEMSRYRIAIPPDPVIFNFNALVQPTVDRIVTTIHEARALRSLRDTLLPKLISGELSLRHAERRVAAAL